LITYKLAETDKDLKQILNLQKNNLAENISNLEKSKEGFFTVKHTLALLKSMNKSFPHIIAKDNNKVIGYALSMTINFSNQIKVLKPMVEEISKIITHDNYIIMGQICIEKNYRGTGVFKNLYQTMKKYLKKTNVKVIITEIDIENKRSFKAHKKVGFKKLKKVYL